MPSGPKVQPHVNRHAAAAMAREAEQRAINAAAKKKAEEDASWEDDDKSSKKKAERAAEREAKAASKAEHKEENRALYEQSAKTAKKGGEMAEFRRLQAEISKQAVEDIEERRKQEKQEKHEKHGNVEADRTILGHKKNHHRGDDDDDDSAAQEVNISISAKGNAAANAQALEDILKGVDPTSQEFARKMGRRAKVLYKEFCTEHSKRVREENPSLRRTQLNDVLWELWQESAQNPFVQRKVALKTERLDHHRRWMEDSGEESEGEEGAHDDKKK